jgi:uncharacterized membrane-anchored protein
MAEPIAAKGAVRIDHSSAPVSEPAGAAAVAGAPPKGPDFSRPPDDPGADRDAPTLRKRSFWGFFSR